MTAIGEKAVPENVEHKEKLMSDSPTFDLNSVLEECFEFIDGAQKNGGKVLIHCQMGQSRSAAVTICFLRYDNCISFF